MMRIGEFRAVPWRGLLAVGVVVLALTAWLAQPTGAATRFVATAGNNSSNTCLSSGAPCKTITHALTQAIANDTISVAAGTYNIALGEPFPLTINTSLSLTGAGAGSTILDATGANQRVITVAFFGLMATISRVTIAGGRVRCTGDCGVEGGGLLNSGTLALVASTVSGNTAICPISGSGRCIADGGGVLNDGTVTIMNATATATTVSCTGFHIG